MKKYILMITVLLAMLTMTACKTKEEQAPVRALTEVYDRMCAEVELPAMIQMEDDYIINYYGVDISTLEEYIFVNAEDALLAETIIMVKVKEGGSTEAVTKLMENLVRDKKAQMQDYLPEQFKIVEKSEIVTKGNYAYLIMSSKQTELSKIAAEEIR